MLATVLMASLIAGPVDDVLRLAQEGRLSDAATRARSARLPPAERELLSGYIHIRAQDFDRAVRSLRRALEQDPSLDSAWLYLGIALHRLGRDRESLAALDRAASVASGLPGFHTLRARTARLSASATVAWSYTQEGLDRFASDPGLIREQVSLLFEVGAFSTAARYAARLFAVSTRPLDDRLWAARVLLDLGRFIEAAPMLEEALALRRAVDAHDVAPTSADIRAQLAWVYARLGRPRAAARLLDPTLCGSVSHAYEAADQWRVAGETGRALAANRFVEPVDRQRAQRLLIFAEAGALERAAALGDHLEHAALDGTTLYALAFAYANTGQEREARALLARAEESASSPALRALRRQVGEAREDD